MTEENTKRVPSTAVQGCFPCDFFILHIGNEQSLCCQFMQILRQEGYNCCSNLEKREKCMADMIFNSENYIVWISSENDQDTDLSLLCEKVALMKQVYFLPYIFRLNNCQVPANLRKYETYELSSDFPSKIPEILDYLKRAPTKECLFEYKDPLVYTYDAFVSIFGSACTALYKDTFRLVERNGYNLFCEETDIFAGYSVYSIKDKIERSMCMSKSLIIWFTNSFFKECMAEWTIEIGHKIKYQLNQQFNLVVLEIDPIPAEYSKYFRLFNRVTIKKQDKATISQHILKILSDTDLKNKINARRLKDQREQIAIARMVNQQPPQKLFSDSRKGINLYKSLVETESEEIYYIKLVVLGQEGVGKTSLVRRLLQESTYHVKRTNGIEINVDKCGVSLQNGQWKFQKDLCSANGNAILFRKLTEMEEYNKLRMDISNEKMKKENKVIFKFKTVGRSVWSFVESENERTKREAWKTSLKGLSVKNSFDSGKTAIISIWDFAGQQEYYPTHQLFLSKNCIVLLVSDISEGFDQARPQETVLYERNSNRKQAQILSDVHDYVQYWTNTVHCYGDISSTEDNLLNPPIIPVATHIDKIQQSNSQDYIDAYRDELVKSLGSDRRKDHLRNFFAISNLNSSEDEIEKLRQYIFAIAKQQDNWGEKVPVKWIPFGNKIEELRLEGKTVVTVGELMEVNKSLLSPLSNMRELISFLVLHHDIGNIIYFEDVGESVIMCPQWFANALRCVVGAKCFKARSLHIDWEQYEKTGFLQKKLIEHLFKETESSLSEFKEHIFNVMEKYDILVCADILDQEYDMHNNDFNYLVPCMVRTSGWQILSNKFINFTKSAILCFEYDFLPSMFFCHVVVYFLRRFKLTNCSDNPSGYVGELYRDVALFDIDDTGCEKVLLCSHKNSIQAQIWIWGIGMENTGRMIRCLLEDDIFVIQRKYDVMKAVEIKIKCPESTLISNKGGINLESLRPVREYWCKEHNIIHECLLFKQYWMLNVTVDDTVSEEERNFIRVSKASVEVLTDILYDLANASACPITKPRNECDITYLYGELRRQGLCLPSRGRWGGDNWPCERVAVNIGDDIERIRLNRNRLQHTSHFEMSIFEFTDRWEKLNALATRFDTRLTPATSYEERLIRLNPYLGRKRDFQNFQTKESKVKVLKPSRRCTR
ncbi:Hypothetical predicted protein [Mytilus galloprovincialis]|uniref:Roc domain-containing protein n=1 Tax=Mytilus galloprovincialis TaxID=29158 RepID=A0A8B6HP42_MYTGA|nr:Hypothetical predicted protein [Mytilus galloprovincialis]